jgi:ABC-type branched-subunit amino acid transport system substrate-binding protein
MLRFRITIFLLLAIACLCCCSKKEHVEYITIGALLPLTGDDFDEGLRALNGLQLAKTEINESSGILGKKLNIIVLNDKGDEEYILQQYNI